MSDNALKIPLQQALRTFTSARANDFAQNMAKSLPVSISQLENDFVHVMFQPINGIFSLPVVKMAQSFSAYAREPTQTKEQGNAVPSDFYLGGVTGFGGGNANFFPRGNLTTLSYQPVNRTVFPSRDYNQYTLAGGTTGVKILQNNPPSTSTPSLSEVRRRIKNQKSLLGMSAKARQAWLNSRTPVEPEPLASTSNPAFMQIDKNGVITHQSGDGNHAITVDQSNKKITVNVPISDHVYLGGDGKTGTYDFVATPSGPSINVKARIG